MRQFRRLIRQGLISLTLLSTLIFIAPQAGAQYQSDQTVSQAAAGQSVVETVNQEFDGRLLYREAFQYLLQYHIALTDSEKRQQWARQWQFKFEGTGELDNPESTDLAIRQMIKSLGQRFDYYFDDRETALIKEEQSGQFVGIGVAIGFKSAPPAGSDEPILSEANPIEIKDVFEGGPAFQAGVRSGDQIKVIDGRSVNGLNFRQMIELVRGKSGTTIEISVERNEQGQKSLIEFTMVRRAVESPVVTTKDLGDGISYVKLANFTARTAPAKMADALKLASTQRALVLDLRGNPGGNMVYAFAIADMLMPEGEIVEIRRREGDSIEVSSVNLLRNMVIEGRNSPDGNVEPQARRRAGLIIPKSMPMVILLDQYSASASELLAGALQYSHRAQVVGMPTRGKGVGQVVIPLPFGRSMNITALEFRPNGVAMDWAGIIPDVEIDRTQEDDRQLAEARSLASELAQRKEARDIKKRELEQEHRTLFEQSNNNK